MGQEQHIKVLWAIRGILAESIPDILGKEGILAHLLTAIRAILAKKDPFEFLRMTKNRQHTEDFKGIQAIQGRLTPVLQGKEGILETLILDTQDTRVKKGLVEV